MGITKADEEKFKRVMDAAGPALEYVCIDVANGYHENFVTFVTRIRTQYPRLVIMAGNVVTGEMTEELILSGADIVKVGIGPGSVCTTRKMTGVGYPQLSAVIECADAAHGLSGLICADGGCSTPGDVAKAFGGGADFVMLGGMFAGHDESGGERVERDGSSYKRFYGMSSKAAMERYSGGVAGYRAAEGKEVLVPYRGPGRKHRTGDPRRRPLGLHLRRRAPAQGTFEAHELRARQSAGQRGLRQVLTESGRSGARRSAAQALDVVGHCAHLGLAHARSDLLHRQVVVARAIAEGLQRRLDVLGVLARRGADTGSEFRRRSGYGSRNTPAAPCQRCPRARCAAPVRACPGCAPCPGFCV